MIEPRKIAIVGAGFSGAIVAARLVAAARRPLTVLLFNRSGQMARGVAYGTRTMAHVLNVPAGRMSAFPEDEDDFLRFARRRLGPVASGAFVSRTIYGDYLEDLLSRAVGCAALGVDLQRVVADVVDLTMAPSGEALELTTSSRACYSADRAILAMGNYPPAHPVLEDSGWLASPRYIGDPWVPGVLNRIAEGDRVLILGTGLTMLDVIAALPRQTREAPLRALSRRALIPAAHRVPSVPPAFDHRPPDIESGPPTARHYVRSVRRHVRCLARQGVDWREVIGSLRSITPCLWQRLDPVERARFLRHVRAFWEIHRHRAAPDLHQRLTQMLSDETLKIEAGRLVDVQATPDALEVRWRPRGAWNERVELVDWFINCTGPQMDVRRISDALTRSLIAKGLISADPGGLGIRTTATHAVLGCGGTPSAMLYCVGPLLRADYFEATAVPELRVHAMTVARQLVADLKID